MELDIARISVPSSGNGTLVEGIFSALEQAIVTGIVAPGTRLGEEALARHFGVSRGPLREALVRLEGRGIVTRSVNAGVRVVELTAGDLIELYQIREMLEGLASRLAATNMTDEEIENLVETEARAGRSGKETYELSYGKSDIHYQIALGAHSNRLTQLLCVDLYSLIRLCRFKTSGMPGRAAQAVRDHQRIAEAIADRDPDLAEMLMRRHIASARAKIESEVVAADSRKGTGRVRAIIPRG